MKKRTKRTLTLLLVLVLCLGLLPTAAMAEEEGEFTITLDASPGKFADGSVTKTIQTHSGESETTKHMIDYPREEPVRDGYYFKSWYLNDPMENPSVWNMNFTANATLKAYWVPNDSGDYFLELDPNGGTCSVERVKLSLDGHTAPTLEEELPAPTRSGYAFEGWFVGDREVKAGFASGGNETAVAKWAKLRTSKTTPSVKAIPDKIDAGMGKIELSLSCTTSGAALDWRPLERALYADGKPSDAESAVKSLLSGNFTGVGLRLTGVRYEKEFDNVDDGAYPSEFYPEGVYPVQELVLTLEGKAISGNLNIELAPSLFVQVVYEDEDTALDAASADIFNAAQVKIPIGSGNPDGPFTVKFDLNCKDPKKDEVPKEQKLNKGQTVDLPDGKKLTAPAENLEFYAWCMKGADDKLYPWKDATAVTADMTLYAGWVRKGTVVKDSEALPDVSKPAETPKPAETAPKFTDVSPTSPFAPAISWAVEKKITNGKTATTFGPGDPCTRAQIVTFLWRAAGSPEPKTMEAEYADVTRTDAYYYKAVQWAAEMGMEESGTFAPNKTCTRGQAMYFIWKAKAGASSAGAAPSFTDLNKNSAYYDAVLWAVGQGVTTGKTATTFAPGDPCTRGQIVTFLYRAYVK